MLASATTNIAIALGASGTGVAILVFLRSLRNRTRIDASPVVDTFSEAATRGIASKSFNVKSKPDTVKKSATTTSTATSKTQNIKKTTKDAPSKTHFVPSKSSEVQPSKSTKAPSGKVFN